MTHTTNERLSAIENRLDALFYMQEATLDVLVINSQRTRKLMALLDDIAVDVTDQGTVIASAITLLDGLTAKLSEAGLDPVKLAALKSAIVTQKQQLADAIVKNTPAAIGASMGGDETIVT